jgi:Ca2+-binding EF-hand superfamily protein
MTASLDSPAASNSDPSSPEKTPEPKSGFSATFWGNSADLISPNSKSSLLLFGEHYGSKNSNGNEAGSDRPGTAPIGRRRRRENYTNGTKKRLVHSFSDRILRPKSRGSSRPSTTSLTSRPARGSAASVSLMNAIRSKKGKTTLAYKQKYKYGVQKSVYHPVSMNTVNGNKLKETLTSVLSSLSKKYGDSSAKEVSRAALRSILEKEPSEKDTNELAEKIKFVEEVIQSESEIQNAAHGGHGAFVFPWQKQPSVVREIKKTITLEASYQPNSLLVKKWSRSRPTLGAIKHERQATKDQVRTKNVKINEMIDEAMHVRSGMHAERQRRKQLIQVFLRAMAKGGIDIREVASTFEKIDKDGSGNIDRSEFTEAISSLALNISTKQSGSLFDAIDIDQSGGLEINEFMEAITGTMRKEVRDSILAVVHSDEVDSLAISNEIKHQKEVKKASDTIVKRVKTLLAQRTFTGGAEAALMKLFMQSDIDHSGSISRDEFTLAMHKLGIELEKFEIDAIVNKADKDGGGELEYWEFVKMLRPPKKKKFVKQDLAADSAGGIGIPVFAAKHENSMELVYGRRSIAIETQRLKRKMLKDQIEIFRPIDARNALHALYVALSSKHMSESQLYEFFMDLDKDGSGTIDEAEFRHTMTKILRLGLTDPQLDVLAMTLDKDGNGDVNYVELKSALNFDKYEEGRQNREAIAKRAQIRSMAPKDLVASKTKANTTFSRVIPFKPFGGHPEKQIPVPKEGGRYATTREAHRQWYYPGPILRPLPHSLATPSVALKSYPQPKIRSLSRPLRKPATKAPYFLEKNKTKIESSNFFSGMLGQRSLMERSKELKGKLKEGSQYSAIPKNTKMNFSVEPNSNRGIKTGRPLSKKTPNAMGSVTDNAVPAPRLRPKSQSQQRKFMSKTTAPSGQKHSKNLTRASTAPTGISRSKTYS